MATLQFRGKSAVWNHHLSVPYHTLEKDAKKSLKGTDAEENLIIEGDNLLALKSLLPKYQGRVKCIYIDPPYNTGNEGWVYSDNVNSPLLREWMGKVVGKENEDLTRHDKWLCMMTPRLKLLRELLSEDGVIFVSIDDNEGAHLKSLMDDIFGENNFVANIVWQKKYAASNDATGIPAMHDYITVYQKTDKFERQLLPRTEKQDAAYKNDDDDGKGPWRSDNLLVKTFSESAVFPITNPNTGKKFLPKKGNSWRANQETVNRWLAEGRIFFGKDGKGAPQLKRYLHEVQQGIVPVTWWTYEDAGHNDQANKELQELFGKERVPFETPKPTKLVKRLLQIATKKDDIVLDSFAGSGTTAHSVLDLNKEDSGTRKFILVEMEDYANNITAERVRRAAKKCGYKAGFTYYNLGSAIDAESILTGKLPTYKEFAKYVYYLATGKNHPVEKKIKEEDSFVGKTDHQSVYLLYEKNADALKKLAITLDWAQKTHAKDKNKKIVYAPACYLDDEALEHFNIKFVSIPYNLFERAV
ncbi:MAG: site-specific DNA-methyltransferase [Patescibacteria group bacterium]